jgi:hypothetical protein
MPAFYATLEVLTRPSPISAATAYLRSHVMAGATQALVGLVTAIPFVVLLAVCSLVARKASAARVACIGIGGLLGTLVVMVPGNLLSWLALSPETVAATPSMLNELYLPLLTLAGLGVGLTAGWVASLAPKFNRPH